MKIRFLINDISLKTIKKIKLIITYVTVGKNKLHAHALRYIKKGTTVAPLMAQILLNASHETLTQCQDDEAPQRALILIPARPERRVRKWRARLLGVRGVEGVPSLSPLSSTRQSRPQILPYTPADSPRSSGVPLHPHAAGHTEDVCTTRRRSSGGREEGGAEVKGIKKSGIKSSSPSIHTHKA